MNEYETALNHILHNTTPHNWTEERIEHDTVIIRALKKQILKRIKKAEIGEGITIDVCPECGKSINRSLTHCGGCGQALDWSEDND